MCASVFRHVRQGGFSSGAHFSFLKYVTYVSVPTDSIHTHTTHISLCQHTQSTSQFVNESTRVCGVVNCASVLVQRPWKCLHELIKGSSGFMEIWDCSQKNIVMILQHDIYHLYKLPIAWTHPPISKPNILFHPYHVLFCFFFCPLIFQHAVTYDSTPKWFVLICIFFFFPPFVLTEPAGALMGPSCFSFLCKKCTALYILWRQHIPSSFIRVSCGTVTLQSISCPRTRTDTTASLLPLALCCTDEKSLCFRLISMYFRLLEQKIFSNSKQT